MGCEEESKRPRRKEQRAESAGGGGRRTEIRKTEVSSKVEEVPNSRMKSVIMLARVQQKLLKSNGCKLSVEGRRGEGQKQ